jgi:sulfur-oxidizing protein SoxA
MRRLPASLAAVALACATSATWAQKTASDGIAEYRAMLQDGNPADLFEAKGEDLWKQARGPKKINLSQCDLGKGPGQVKGAWVQLPRYFADTQKVQDLESRLLTCMETLQGFDAQEIRNTPYGKGEQTTITALATWVAAESKGMSFKLPQTHAEEKRMFELGKKLFYVRAGTHDFACATCHSQEGKRIRLQDLPNLNTTAGAGSGFGAWPAYRVSNGQMWGMQLRLNDCYRQQRFPYAVFGNEASTALSVYLGVTAQGVATTAPAIRR